MQSSTQPPTQPPIKLTTAQLWLAHTLFVISIAAAVAAGVTVYGAFASGNHDWTVIGGLALAAAVAVVSKGWADKIQGNANLLPAIMDYAQDIRDIVAASPTVMPVPVQPSSPLVVIHTNATPDIAQPTQPPVQIAPLILPQQPIVAPLVQQTGNAQGWPPPQSVPQGESVLQPLQMSNAQDVPGVSPMLTDRASGLHPDTPQGEDALIERNWNPSGILPVVQ